VRVEKDLMQSYRTSRFSFRRRAKRRDSRRCPQNKTLEIELSVLHRYTPIWSLLANLPASRERSRIKRDRPTLVRRLLITGSES
jgi:hypothetical protein